MDVEHTYVANAAPHYQQEHQHHWQSHTAQLAYPTSPTQPAFPPYYHRPPDHFSQPQASNRPSTANLSLNLSSLSVEPSAPSPHVASNPNGSLSGIPVSPDGVSAQSLHSQQQQSQQQQHVFASQIPTSPFTYSTHEWHSQIPITRSNSSSDMRSDTPMSNSARNGTIRPSSSIEENSVYDCMQSSHPSHHAQHRQHPSGHDLQHHHSFSSSAHDEQERASSSFPDSHAESPTSATSDPPDEFRSADTEIPTNFEFAKFDNVTGRPGTASKSPSSNNFVAKLYQMISDPKSAHFIAWTELGTSFVVSSVGEFSRSILGSHFKHNNFSSFVRQLNMYGFHKINRTPRAQRTSSDNQIWEFSHQKFLRGRPDLLDEIKRKALDAEPGVRQRVDLPSEVAQQLSRMANDHQQVIKALYSERAKVDRLTNIVKTMYDTMQQMMPGSMSHAPFPADLLEPAEAPPILITSPSDPPYSENSFQPPSSFWNEPSSSLSTASLGTISPTSSPTSADFPPHHSRPTLHTQTRSHLRHALPPMNIPSLPRFDHPSRQSLSSPGGGEDSFDDESGQEGRSSGPKRQRMNPNTSSDASSPGGGTSPITASGGSFAGGRKVGGRSGISSTPSSAVHLTGDQQRQIPIPSSQSQGQIQARPMARTGGRTLSRARSDSAPLGMGLGQVWQVGSPVSVGAAPTGGITFSTSGSSSRPRSGTQLAHGRVAPTTSASSRATVTNREDYAAQRTYGSVPSSVGSSSGSSNIIGAPGAPSGVHEEAVGDSDDSGHPQLQHQQQPGRR